MRKGARRNDWTLRDERYLIENAGRIPKRDICLHLKRSGKAVERKAAQLRARGHAVELRCYESQLALCPGCGAMRCSVGRDGTCEICRRKEQLEAIQARIAGFWPLLTQEQRDVYEATEAITESRNDPMPRAPNVEGLSYYARAKAEEDYAIACERRAARNLRREVKAAQKRKERIEKKVRINGG